MSVLDKKVNFHRESLHFIGTIHDVICVFVSAFIFNFICFEYWMMDIHHITSTVTISLIISIVNLHSNFIVAFRLKLVFDIAWRFSLFFSLAYGAVYMTFNTMLPGLPYDKSWVIYTLIFSFFFSTFNRVALSAVLWRVRSKAKYKRRVFLIGSAESVVSLGKRMRHYKSEGFSIAGVQRLIEKPDQDIIERIRDRVRESNASEVWISLPLDMGQLVKTLLHQLRNETVEVRFLPVFSDEKLLNHRASELLGRYSIDLSVTPISGQASLVKRLEDIVLGALIFILVSPLFLLIGIAIKLTSRGPIFFTQYRTGVSGNHFKVYKFRTMKVHKEEGFVTQAEKNDERITKLGAFLRKTSLDEFPQLINVLQGNMSLVGPRPHTLCHNEYYQNVVESYMRRHMVKPGITGWAQVNGYRGQTDTLDKMEKRVEYDLWYIDNWSVLFDIKIILNTVVKGFVHKNAY